MAVESHLQPELNDATLESPANRNKMLVELEAKELESIGRQMLDVIRRLNSIVRQLDDTRKIRNGS